MLTGILAMQPIETFDSVITLCHSVDRYSGDAANWNVAFPLSSHQIPVDRYSGDAANWNLIALEPPTEFMLTGILAMQPIETIYNNS